MDSYVKARLVAYMMVPTNVDYQLFGAENATGMA